MDSIQTGYITDVAYTDNYYEQLSPVTLNYLAALNGHSPRDLADFDYCELGCGQALSLVVHAATHPGGRFVGIDLNPEHIRQAGQLAVASGLGNLDLIAEPVSDALAASGLPEFDFIVMHGLYSWVSETVRASIRRFVDARLKPGGFVLVSYNALPGCAARQPLRDIMRRFALPLSENSLARAELGLSYLRLMLNAQVPFFRLNPELAKYAESLFERDLHYIAHEFFHESWDPLDIEHVSGGMGALGLQLAGSLPLWQNHPEADIPENLAGLFSGTTGRVTREVHKDFIYNTVFRTDLYVRPAPDGRQPGRTKALWNMPFSASTAPEAVQLAVQRGALQLPLNTRESRLVFNLLQDAPRSPAELSERPGLKDMTPDALVDALCWWVLSGQVRPANICGARDPASLPHRLNRSLLTAAMRAPEQQEAWLASPRFGSAFAFDKTQALALCALAGAPGNEFAVAFHRTMQDCGLCVEENDTAMRETDLLRLANELFDELETAGVLEQARRLGVIE